MKFKKKVLKNNLRNIWMIKSYIVSFDNKKHLKSFKDLSIRIRSIK